MIDRNVQQLLQQAIDTPTKLHLLLLFHEQTLTNITPREMAERVCRDIWSVTQAMAEMAEDGILQVTALPDGDYYRYQPRTEHIEAIRKLIQTYNDRCTGACCTTHYATWQAMP
ncbi:MAG: hypothetical protein HC893_13255 [Chloroflexaceae bacterium]|nr:hypothetical protein [Chloroflexaceae bacterium]